MIKRILALLLGFVGININSIEGSHPEYLIEKYKNDIKKRKEKAKIALIKFMVDVKQSREKTNKLQLELEAIKNPIKRAIGTKNEELLTQLYLQENELQKTLDFSTKLQEEAEKKLDQMALQYNNMKIQGQTQLIKLEFVQSRSDLNKLRKSLNLNINFEDFTQNYEKANELVQKQQFKIDAEEELNTKDVTAQSLKIDADYEKANERAKKVLGELNA